MTTSAQRSEQYMACVRDGGLMDLEVGKLYCLLPPEPGDSSGEVRVVDDSGEDYLYPASWFVAVDVPEASARALRAARRSRRRSGAEG
jgi:hypothetical protein